MIEGACEEGKEQLLNVVHAFASEADQLLQRLPEDKLDAGVDAAYTEHLETLQAMSSAGVCYSAMLSPSGQCTKPRCPHRHDRDSFKYGVMEQIVKYMGTSGYKDALLAGLLDPIKIKPDWDLAIPPPAARATMPSNTSQKNPQRPSSTQPFTTPQAARYASRGDQKLHVTSQVSTAQSAVVSSPVVSTEAPDFPPDYTSDEEHDDPPPLLRPISQRELDMRRRARDMLSQTSFETLDDGTRLYHLSNSVVGGMPMVTVQLSCGVNLEAHTVEVDGPLDTGATMCYISTSLLEELEPSLDPRSIKWIASKVRMGAPPDHLSDRQVDLKVQWSHQGRTEAAILRFVVLHTENLRIILGLNAILLAGLLEPLVSVLREMQDRAVQPSTMFLMESGEDPDPPVYSLHVTSSSSEESGTAVTRVTTFVGAGSPPTTAPARPQILEPEYLPVNFECLGSRHLMLCPLYALRPDELASWPEARLDHDIAIQRFFRDDQLSYFPRFRPFYWMDLHGELHQEAESPPTCQPNYNGRYTIWYDVAIWQWGIFTGSGDSLRFTAYNTYEDVMRFLHPECFDTSYWPFSVGRLAAQPQLIYPRLEPSQGRGPPNLLPPAVAVESSQTTAVSAGHVPAASKSSVERSLVSQSRSLHVHPLEIQSAEDISPIDSDQLASDDSHSTPAESPPLTEPPVLKPSSSKKRRRRLRGKVKTKLFEQPAPPQAGSQPIHTTSDTLQTVPPDEQIPSTLPDDASEHDANVTSFADHLIAANAFVSRWQTTLLGGRMSTHFQQDFPQQFLRFLRTRRAEAAFRDYLEHSLDNTYWRTQLVHQYFPDDGTQPLHPAFTLLRAAFDSLAASRSSRRRTVKPVRHVYDPDVTPWLPQHGSSALPGAQPRSDAQAASKPPSRSHAPASKKGSPASRSPKPLGFRCPHPGCNTMVTARQEASRATACELHSQVVDLANSSTSSTDSLPESPVEPISAPPPSPPDSGSSSPKSTPPQKRRRRRKSRRADSPPVPFPRPPDDPPGPSDFSFREGPVSPDSPPPSSNAGGEKEKTPTSPMESDQPRDVCDSPTRISEIFEQLSPDCKGVPRTSARVPRTSGPISLIPFPDTVMPFPLEPRHPLRSSRERNLFSPIPTSYSLFTISADESSPQPDVTPVPKVGAIVEPWSTEPLETPPEETNTIDVGIFKGMEELLETADQELYRKYLSNLPDHVDPQFAEAQPIMELLQGELARRVFVPFHGEWTGVNGVEPIELQFLPTMPERMAANARPLNPVMIEKAYPVFKRMVDYMLERSVSPCASPIVIAAKATFPFVRICGDYRRINRYIVVPQDVIPNVRKELEKTRDFHVYADLDCMNAFHQHALAPYTRERLAIATPWGLFQPKFLPEGVGPASGILQKRMESVFEDFKDWMVVMFDNLLVLATDYQDLYDKTVKVLQRCDERHVLLKLEKSFIGVRTANFFGYEVSAGTYKLSQKRREAIAAIPMPTDQKSMQRFLGAALYFKTHVPAYSDLTSDLNDMVRKEFNWDPTTWTKDYVGAMQKLKDAILHSSTLHFPDYSLPWVLRCDASTKACGGTLLQERREQPEAPPVFEVIAFVSSKFSGAAERWDIPKKEAFAIYFSVKELSYYLEVKPFVIETDHANLVWIEKSEAAIIIRWRLYLQGFAFKIRHIPGKANIFADMLSRMYAVASEPWDTDRDSSPSLLILQHFPDTPPPGPLEYNTLFLGAADYPPVEQSLDDLLRGAHIVNRKHCGVRETRANLNRFYPGHRIHYDVVNEFCASCVVCQKNRRGMLKLDTLEPVVKHLKPPHRRSRVGIDTFHCTPHDKQGNVCLHVIVNHFTNHVALYPSVDHTAVGVARALFQFFTTYGLYDEIASDPGSNLTADVTEELIRLFGTNHRFGLVGVHTSSGVEGTNSLVLTHLRAICHEKQFRERWGSPEVVGLVQFIINDSVCGETGIRRFDNTFGSEAGVYFRLPERLAESARSHEYLRLLDEDLQRLTELSRSSHAKVINSRRTAVTESSQNLYLRGELVLVQRDPDKPLPSKLCMPFAGPYEVIEHVGNDVKCRHLATHAISEFPVTRLKIFHGSREAAKLSAAEEVDQSQVKCITGWRGDPLVRTTMEFRTEFNDGDIVWLPYSVDLDQTQAFGDYVSSIPTLHHLQFSAQVAREFIAKIRATPITGYSAGDKVYVDIRCYSTQWYDTVLTFLPDRYDKTYVVLYEILAVSSRCIKAYCPCYDERWEAATGPCKLGAYWCYAFACHRVLTDSMVLVTPELCRQHPELISPDESTRKRVLEHHFPSVKPPKPLPRGVPPTTRVLRSTAQAPAQLMMLRPVKDSHRSPHKHFRQPPIPPKSEDPKHLRIDVQDMLRRQAEDAACEADYYSRFGFASPSGRHVSPPKMAVRVPLPLPHPLSSVTLPLFPRDRVTPTPPSTSLPPATEGPKAHSPSLPSSRSPLIRELLTEFHDPASPVELESPAAQRRRLNSSPPDKILEPEEKERKKTPVSEEHL